MCCELFYDRWTTRKCRVFFFDFFTLVGLLPAGDMYIFSCDSSSIDSNVCRSVGLLVGRSVGPSVCPSVTTSFINL